MISGAALELESMTTRNRRILSVLPLAVAALLLALLVARGASWFMQWRAEPQLPAAATAPQNAADVIPEAAPDYADLTALHLFGVAETAPQPPPKTQIPETRAQLKLHGVFVDGEQSGAIIGAQNGRQHYVRLHGQLPGGAKLKEVHADRVVIERNGRDEALRFPKTKTLVADEAEPTLGSAQPTDAQPVALTDLAGAAAGDVARHLRIFPVQENESFVGYRILPGRDRGLYQRLGLQPGDIVIEVDGQPVAEPADADGFQRQLTTHNEVTLTVRRGAETLQVRAASP